MAELEESFQTILKFYYSTAEELYKEMDIDKISKRKFEYLRVIDKQKGITFSDLSKACQVSKPTITEVVTKLISTGLAYKEKSEDDGRTYYIYLTEKGKTIAKTNKIELTRTCDKFRAVLNEEDIDNLKKIAKKLY